MYMTSDPAIRQTAPDFEDRPQPVTTDEAYEDACDSYVTRRRALRFVTRHGASLTDFDADCGVRDHYRGRVILDWLGY